MSEPFVEWSANRSVNIVERETAVIKVGTCLIFEPVETRRDFGDPKIILVEYWAGVE